MNERAQVVETESLERPTLVPHRPRVLAPQHSWWSSPASLGEAMELAQLIANSEFAPKDYRGKAASVLIAIRMGHDVGLSPMQSLQNIAVINGRPAIWGDAALALVQSANILERFHETMEGTQGQDNYTAVCIAKRKGMPDEVRRTFSVSDARRAGLWGKTGREGQPTPWVTYPNRMLQMRARGFTIRDVAADRLMGLILAEEAMDLPIPMLPDATGTYQVTSLTMPEPAVVPDVFDRIPEALRDNLEQAFTHLHMPPGLRMAKLHEFLGGEGTPEEGALALLEWCKDEYAKRKTGKPRKTAANSKPIKPGAAPPSVETPVQEPPTPPPAPMQEPEPPLPPPDVPESDAPWPADDRPRRKDTPTPPKPVINTAPEAGDLF